MFPLTHGCLFASGHYGPTVDTFGTSAVFSCLCTISGLGLHYVGKSIARSFAVDLFFAWYWPGGVSLPRRTNLR